MLAVVILLGLIIIGLLLRYGYITVPPAPARISQSVPAYDNQYDVFRDMEPETQTRVGAWVGFLQEDLLTHRTGPIGDFIGNDSDSGNAPLYAFQTAQVGTAFSRNTCDGCACVSDTTEKAGTATDTIFAALMGKDNKTVCSRTRDGVKYACQASCCNNTCGGETSRALTE